MRNHFTRAAVVQFRHNAAALWKFCQPASALDDVANNGSSIRGRVPGNVLGDGFQVLHRGSGPNYRVSHLEIRCSTSSCVNVFPSSAAAKPLRIFSITYKWY